MTNETPPTVSLAEGWAIVPVDPTEAMIDRFVSRALCVSVHGDGGWSNYAREQWSAMLAASPAHTPALDTRLPEGMVRWEGGDAAPEDWDGGPVLLDGDPDPLEADYIYTWRRGDGEDWVNIIAYTPRTPHPAVEVTEKRADVLPYLESEARRFAGFYPEGSDGRNTFIIFADKIAASASTTEDGV